VIGVLLINLGTPDAPTTPAVRRYLRQFLSDPRVIDINPVARQLLLNLIILPFRSPKSAAAYRKIWTNGGSPLLVHTQNLAKKVAEKLGTQYAVEIGMRYGNPSIESGLKKLIQKGVKEIRVLPLFPQYASSSSGSAQAELFRIAGRLWHIPPITILPPFFEHPGFIQSFAEVGKPIMERFKADHVLFSFHGLPERHIQKGDPYRDQSLQTAKAIAQKLNLPENRYTVCFQSRLGRTPWIKPYTDLLIVDLAKSGKKRIAVFCPAFVADCLETLEEIGIRAKESALAHGAEALELVPSLNAHPTWVEAVCEMVGNSR
jgi:ferrochelatase